MPPTKDFRLLMMYLAKKFLDLLEDFSENNNGNYDDDISINLRNFFTGLRLRHNHDLTIKIE